MEPAGTGRSPQWPGACLSLVQCTAAWWATAARAPAKLERCWVGRETRCRPTSRSSSSTQRAHGTACKVTGPASVIALMFARVSHGSGGWDASAAPSKASSAGKLCLVGGLPAKVYRQQAPCPQSIIVLWPRVQVQAGASPAHIKGCPALARGSPAARFCWGQRASERAHGRQRSPPGQRVFWD